MTYSVQLVFSDRSLGGTSRSALELGRAWRDIGADVHFRPQLPIHTARLEAFRETGTIHADHESPSVKVGDADIVHYHHGGWSDAQRAVAHRLISEAKGARTPPTLLTHNVFAVSDRILQEWPTTRTVGLLSNWGSMQYRLAMGQRAAVPIIVVPNAQDTQFFRPPTDAERGTARLRLGIGLEEMVSLRIGSPVMQKWSRHYIDIVRRASHLKYIFVGVPSDLSMELSHFQNVSILPIASEDERVRDLYWAADSFIHLADRGESFGNVLLESLLCGTPVVSLARPLRDNAPWEFDSLPGFSFVNSLNEATTALTAICSSGRDCSNTWRLDAREEIERSYSRAAVAQILSSLVDGEIPPLRPLRRFGVANVWQSAVLHNPISDKVKRMRFR